VRTHTKSPQQYLSDFRNGLLSEQSRKTSERIALTQGVSVRDLQHFIGQGTWPSAPVLTRHQHSIAETLGAADGVVLLDESGVVKQGHDSLGVAPHYCGAVGQGVYCTWLI
jgi:SRSO17 transposase